MRVAGGGVAIVALAAWVTSVGSRPARPKHSAPRASATEPCNHPAEARASDVPDRVMPTPITPARKAETLVEAAWGGGPNELGRRVLQEGAPEAPMGLAVAKDGSFHVLDQVNSRIQVFTPGYATRSIELPADTFQDIVIDAAGNDVVMDRLATGTIAFLGGDGRVDHTVPLVGPGVEEGGGVTGLFARADGTWVEVDHTRLVRVALANGDADPERPSVSGRFSFDGKTAVHAALAGASSALVEGEPLTQGGTAFRAMIEMPLPILSLHALETDARGRTILVANLVREAETDPFDLLEQRETAVVIDARGREVKRVELAPPEGADEQMRPIRVADDGTIYQLVARERGASIERTAR